MKWSKKLNPNKSESSYTHITAYSPLGIFIIEWKSWKNKPSYCLELNDTYLFSSENLEESKLEARTHLENKKKEIEEFLTSTTNK